MKDYIKPNQRIDLPCHRQKVTVEILAWASIAVIAFLIITAVTSIWYGLGALTVFVSGIAVLYHHMRKYP